MARRSKLQRSGQKACWVPRRSLAAARCLVRPCCKCSTPPPNAWTWRRSREIARRGALFDAVGRYAQGMLALVMQSTACIGLHHVQERCCRWLLMTLDRVGSEHFDLSHEFLAMMLGTTRPTVTIVAGTLQHAGLIRYTHGHMTIVDRDGLEA